MIKKGEVPKGYKKTSIGIICKDFKKVSLKNIGNFKNGINFTKNGGNNIVNFLGVGDFKNNVSLNDTEVLGNIAIDSSDENLQDYFLKRGDIVFVRSNGSKELVGRSLLIKKAAVHTVYSGFCIRFRLKKDSVKTSAEYVNAWLEKGILKNLLKKENRGTNISNLNQEILSKVVFYISEFEEQTKINAILDMYTKKAALIEEMINAKKIIRQWLMQNLLSEKKNLSGFNNAWNKVKIKEIITEVNEKTTLNNEYEIFSVTKNGISKQSEHFNKQIASDNNIGYKILRKGNLVFSTMNLWMGSLDVLEKYEVGIVSPAYKIFDFNKNFMIPSFGKFHMKSSHMIWIYNINSEQGASIVRKNLDMEGLMNTNIKIPPIDEQVVISKILSTADKEIKLLEKQLEQIKLEKKAIMQLLLTGIVRVN